MLACGKEAAAPPAPDTTAPTVPTGVTASPQSPTRIGVSWQPSTDNVRVTAYRLFRDGSFVRSLTGTAASDSARTPGVAYCYAVSAVDSAGNESERGGPSCATTSNQAPIAVLAGPDSGLTGVSQQFSAYGSFDHDGTIATFSFAFGDGTTVTGADPVAQHAYAAVGRYVVTLTVTDDAGAAASTTREISIGLGDWFAVNVSSSPHLSQTAWIARDGSGAYDVTWESYGSPMFARSTDGGGTFSQPSYVVAPSDYFGSDDGFSAGQVKVASTADGVIHVAWTAFDTYYGGAEILYAHSADGGATFSAPVIVSTPDQWNSVTASLAVDAAGTIGVAWYDDDLTQGATRIAYSSSSDGGRTFAAPVVVADSGGCTSATVSGSQVHVVWTYGPFGEEQILYSRSADGGRTFSSPVAIDRSPSKSWCPELRLGPTGTIHVAWPEGPAFTTGVMYTRSTDGGASFGPVSVLTPNGGCPSLAEDTAGRVYATWCEGSSSYLAVSDNGGASFGAAVKVPDMQVTSGGFQVVAGPPNRLAAVWHAVAPGKQYSDIFFARATVH